MQQGGPVPKSQVLFKHLIYQRFWANGLAVFHRWLAAGLHVVTPNKRLGSGPISDYRAAMAETRAGRGMFFGEARVTTSCKRGANHCQRLAIALPL